MKVSIVRIIERRHEYRQGKVNELLQETKEISKILGASLLTLKNKRF